MKMESFEITDSGRREVVVKCCAQKTGFYEVSRAAFQHRFCFSRAQFLSARTCAGENGDFSKSLRTSKTKCRPKSAFLPRNSTLDGTRISTPRRQVAPAMHD